MFLKWDLNDFNHHKQYRAEWFLQQDSENKKRRKWKKWAGGAKQKKESGRLVYEELTLSSPFHILVVILNTQDLM